MMKVVTFKSNNTEVEFECRNVMFKDDEIIIVDPKTTILEESFLKNNIEAVNIDNSWISCLIRTFTYCLDEENREILVVDLLKQ